MAIIKSIYWEQNSREDLVYKFPFNNVTTGSVLTVNESVEDDVNVVNHKIFHNRSPSDSCR